VSNLSNRLRKKRNRRLVRSRSKEKIPSLSCRGKTQVKNSSE
jgi:hypothetical protein